MIVLPFRLSGFGPYAKVLEGQAYVADQRGLLPHASITHWVARQTDEPSNHSRDGGRSWERVAVFDPQPPSLAALALLPRRGADAKS